MPASFYEFARGGHVLIVRTVCRSITLIKMVREGRCGVDGVMGAGGRGHERPRCRNSAVVGQNRAQGALWEVSVLSFQTGGRVGADCWASRAVAAVPFALG